MEWTGRGAALRLGILTDKLTKNMDRLPIFVQRVTAPVRQQVEDGLRSLIAEGHFRPGERLVERELCEWLGVSRPVLREALRQLEAEGLLTNLPNRGIIVSRLTVQDARDIFQVRAQLESMAARLFTDVASDEEVAGLGRRVAAIERALAESDGPAVRQAKNAFYDALIDGCGNRVLGQTLRILHNRIQLLRTVMLSEPGRMRAASVEIRAMFDAIAARQPARAHALSLQHIDNAERAMEDAFAAHDSRIAELATTRRLAGLMG